MIPDTQEKAKEINWRYFYDGAKCDNGHMSAKYTADGMCVQCRDEQIKRAMEEGPEKVKTIKHSRKIKLYRKRKKERASELGGGNDAI